MTVRRRDVEQWMSHRRFPKDIRKYVNYVSLFKLIMMISGDISYGFMF